MANPLPTFRSVVASMNADDKLKINGVYWRAGAYHDFLVASSDSRLTYPTSISSDGTLHIVPTSGAVDTTVTLVSSSTKALK